MKQRHIRLACLALLSAALVSGSAPAAAQSSPRFENGTLLQIAAEGSVEVKPDGMSVDASVITTGATAAEALARNNELAARLIAAVRASNLEIASLKTERLDVKARFAEEDRGRAIENGEVPRIVGYVADNTLEVELKQVAQAGELISLMFEAGANEIRGPYFYLHDPAPAHRLAERAAIAQAQAEAENYASALGMRVSRVLRVFDRAFSDRDETGIYVSGSRIPPTPIEPGEVTYSATVNVEFLLEPVA